MLRGTSRGNGAWAARHVRTTRHSALSSGGTRRSALLCRVGDSGFLLLHTRGGRRTGRLTRLLGGSACGDGALHQEGRDLGVDLLDQLLEQLVGLKLVDEKRILLLKAGVLHVAA